MGKTALILGATGLTGKLLLNRLLEDSDYEKIKIFTRRDIELNHPKLEVFVGDLLNLEIFDPNFKGDELFCCIGTTAKQTKDKAIYKQIDFGIPVAAANLCKKNQINCLFVISALGANKNSRIFYNRTKGEMEQAVLNVHIPNTYILRPSLITGVRQNRRFGEWIGAVLMRIVSVFLVGKYKKYRAIKADVIARAMHHLANRKLQSQILESDQIQELGGTL